MREEMHRFFRAARGAGVRVSPAESIDAMKAVADVGFADRIILRDTLLLTLAKSQDEKQALGECFDLFFSQPEVKDPAEPEESEKGAAEDSSPGEAEPGDDSGAPSPELGELAQMLMSRDRNAIAAAMASASSAASLSDIRYFTQRGIFSSRILEQLGIERLRDDLDALTATNPAEAERLAAALQALRENVRDVVNQALVLYGREETENLRNEILRNAPLARLERRQVEQMKALIRAIARRLRERYSKPRKRQRRGHLDLRRTLRRNAGWGSVPFLISWKRRHRDRPKIVAICDVSGSVAQVSDFFLLLIHSLHEVVDDVRSFAFSGNLIEVSDILDSKTPGRGDGRDHVEGRIRLLRLWRFTGRFREGFHAHGDAEDDGDRARRCPHQQPRSARRHPAHHLGAIEAAGLAQPRRADGLGLGRFRNAALCLVLQRGAPVRHRKTARARGDGHRGFVPVVYWGGCRFHCSVCPGVFLVLLPKHDSCKSAVW